MTDFTQFQLTEACNLVAAFKDAETEFYAAQSDAFKIVRAERLVAHYVNLKNYQVELGVAFHIPHADRNCPASVRTARRYIEEMKT